MLSLDSKTTKSLSVGIATYNSIGPGIPEQKFTFLGVYAVVMWEKCCRSLLNVDSLLKNEVSGPWGHQEAPVADQPPMGSPIYTPVQQGLQGTSLHAIRGSPCALYQTS